MCDQCSRVYKRLDHLQRHQATHNPNHGFKCPWPECGVIFKRKDVMDKHYNRHTSKPRRSRHISHEMRAAKDLPTIQLSNSNTKADGGKLAFLLPTQRALELPLPPNSQSQSPKQTSVWDDPTLTSRGVSSCITNRDADAIEASTARSDPLLLPIVPRDAQRQSASSELHRPTNQDIPSLRSIQGSPNKSGDLPLRQTLPSIASLSPSNLTEWLLQEEPIQQGFTMVHPNLLPLSHNAEVSPVSLLEAMFAVSPKFPPSDNRTRVDDAIKQRLVNLLPPLVSHPDFDIPQIERCLEIYWLLHHPQYPILHRPSFCTAEAHPLLLMAMVVIGASLASCTGDVELVFSDPHQLAEDIGTPLRWLIFTDPQCKPPVTIWVIQALLLLETYEITSLLRVLHERAYLYHATKIQLLRRSPILGGDPNRPDDDDDDYDDVNQLNVFWKKWIEMELMKRVTLLAFYLDVVNATVYGHEIVLYAYQIKLRLPCDDRLWEYENIDNTKPVLAAREKPERFIHALHLLLNRDPVETTPFGRRVLLAGLLLIKFQMQQKDLHLASSEWARVKQSWHDTISLAIDVWRTDICFGGCCSLINSVGEPTHLRSTLPPMLRDTDTRCKFALYHISQIYMQIPHYDYIIYAGAPSRMNVKASRAEYQAVERRVHQWAVSHGGRILVVHAYMLLCEMLLLPDNADVRYRYNADADPFLHRRNMVALAILVIFAYNFCLDGPESEPFDATNPHLPPIEDGYEYLIRIRHALSSGPGGPFQNVGTPAAGPLLETPQLRFHNSLSLYAETLLAIPLKRNMVGLLRLLSDSYRSCKWEIGREYANLLQNCAERSLGRVTITCDHMYVKR